MPAEATGGSGFSRLGFHDEAPSAWAGHGLGVDGADVHARSVTWVDVAGSVGT